MFDGPPRACLSNSDSFAAAYAENQTQEMMRDEAEIEEEKRLAARIVAQAKATAPRLATMRAISEHRNRWVAYKVGFNMMPGTLAGRSVAVFRLTFKFDALFCLLTLGCFFSAR